MTPQSERSDPENVSGESGGCDRNDLPSRLANQLLDAAKSVPPGYSPAMSYGRHKGPHRPDARSAAVLILVYRHDHRWWLPLTLRPSHLSAHADQICLPGGAVDLDETSDMTARREFAEELGIDIPEARLLGCLAPLYVFNSNYRIVPWVAWSPIEPNFVPNPSEVAEVIRVPLKTVLNTWSSQPLTIRRGQLTFTAPALSWQRHQIWGATRVILADFARYVTRAVG